MTFNSLTFVCFFLLVLPAYLVLRHRSQNRLLLLASWLFYGWWDWRFLALLGATTVLDYLCARGIEVAKSPGRRRLYFGISLVGSLGQLAVFKYYDFFATSFGSLLDTLGLTVHPPLLSVILPVGISFYTFQTLGYVIDVYRGRITAERSFPDFALFVAFFPQLVAGPIERASRLLPQVKLPRNPSWLLVRAGAWLILLGYFKKTVVADNLAPFVQRLRTDIPSLSGGELLVGFYAMVFFLYADFSGYSDIARGTAKLLGFDLMENFKRPFFSRSPPDFWRRWHISLSEWFRDYVFTPLVRLREKGGRSGTYMILCAVLTLLLCGLWHGPSWNFVVFGLYHGVLLALYYVTRPVLRRLWRASRLPDRVRAALSNVVAFHLLSVGVIFFIVPAPADWLLMLTGILRGAYDAGALPALETLLLFGGVLVLVDFAQEWADDALVVKRLPAYARLACYVTLFALIVLAGATQTHEFVYFQF